MAKETKSEPSTAKVRLIISEYDKKEIVKMLMDEIRNEYHIFPRQWGISPKERMNLLEKTAFFVSLQVGVPLDEMKTVDPRANHYVSHGRQITWLICREFFKKILSYPFIGAYFKKDHATVIYHLKTIRGRIKVEKEVREEVERILEQYKVEFARDIEEAKKINMRFKTEDYLNSKME